MSGKEGKGVLAKDAVKPKAVGSRPEIKVPESVLKTQARRAKEGVVRRLIHAKKLKKAEVIKQKAIVHAKKYIDEYAATRKNLIQQRRLARTTGRFFAEPEPKVAFVIRIRGILGVSPKPRKIMRLLRLDKMNKGVFIRLQGATIPMLKLIEPYVTYGYPSLATIKQLVYKRGHLKIRNNRIPIIDNNQIEAAMGKFGIICVEDIVHELYTAGPNFSKVSRLLWPFTLKNPRGGFVKKRTHFVEGGDSGNRQELINKLVARMV